MSPHEGEHQGISHGVVKCDTCGVEVIRKVERDDESRIKPAMEAHTKSTGHKEYSFYMQHVDKEDLGSDNG
jgi:hypothetical protein